MCDNSRKYSEKPYRNTLCGKVRWFISEYFWDLDHWAKYCHHVFETEEQAVRFLAERSR